MIYAMDHLLGWKEKLRNYYTLKSAHVEFLYPSVPLSLLYPYWTKKDVSTSLSDRKVFVANFSEVCQFEDRVSDIQNKVLDIHHDYLHQIAVHSTDLLFRW